MSLSENTGVITVLGANGSEADEAPTHGCGGCLMTNDVSADARTLHVANRRVEHDSCGGCLVTNDVSADARTYRTDK